MQSIGALHKTSWDYLVREGYYAKDEGRPGFWFGCGVEALQLSGAVDRATFHKLHRGFGPHGEKLVQNAGVLDQDGIPKHHPGWDLVYSAPKWVSVLWSQSGPEIRAIIEAAVIEAACDALRVLENTAIFTRKGRGGAVRERAEGLIAAGFLHETSRANEPQLHVHFAVFNEVLCQDGKWRTMHGITSTKTKTDVTRSRLPFFEEKMASGALFQASLAARLEKALHLRISRQETGFEVEGIPKELCERFSSRRHEILDEMKRRGLSGSKAAEKVTRETRAPKSSVPREELFRRWRARAEGFDLSGVYREHPPRDVARESALVETAAREQLAGQKGSIKRTEVLRAVAQEAQGRGVDAEAVLATARRIFDEKAPRPVRDMDAARAVRLVEKVVRRSGANRTHALGVANVLLARKQVEFLCGHKLAAAERDDLARITRARGSIQIISTDLETPRYDVLAAARTAWERGGLKVLGVSPSWASAKAYEERTGVHSITLWGFLQGLTNNRGLLRGYRSALEKSWKEHGLAGFASKAAFIKYAVKASGKWIKLSEKTVLVLDNPRAIPLPILADIVRRVHKARAKLVLLDNPPGADETRSAALLGIIRAKQLEADLERLVRQQERERERNY